MPWKANGVFNNKCIEYKSKGRENTSIKQYLENIRPYLGDITDDRKASGECKIHLKTKLTSWHQKIVDRVNLCILRVRI